MQRETAEAFAHKYGIPYVETSAKEGHNVVQVFNELSDRIKVCDLLVRDCLSMEQQLPCVRLIPDP